MIQNFAVIGGDARIAYLASILAKENNVLVYGQEKFWETQNNKVGQEYKTDNEKMKNIVFCNTMMEALTKANIVISSIPFSKDGINVYAPFSKEQIKINSFMKNLENKTLFAGSISNELQSDDVKIVDLMKQEDLTVLNTIATAEGAISDIILNTDINIHGSKILILGFGRVAKVLALKLEKMDAVVTCAARKNEDFAWMEAYGLRQTNINSLGENLKEYDTIINTVPQLILDESKLEFVRKDCLLLDLASKPGGIDAKACEDRGLKFIWSLAIPGKVAPLTSAKYIKQTIEKII